MEGECQHHVDSSHQGHGAGLFNLQGLCEEGLAGDTQDCNQHQHPAITAAEWDFPFPEDGHCDDALDETDDSIVPDREVVVDAFPDLAKDNECKRSSDGSYE